MYTPIRRVFTKVVKRIMKFEIVNSVLWLDI